MTCREFIIFPLEYVSGELPASEHAQFEAHLDVCPDWLAYLKSYEMTIKLRAAAYADTELNQALSQDAPEELVQAILSAGKTTSEKRSCDAEERCEIWVQKRALRGSDYPQSSLFSCCFLECTTSDSCHNSRHNNSRDQTQN